MNFRSLKTIKPLTIHGHGMLIRKNFKSWWKTLFGYFYLILASLAPLWASFTLFLVYLLNLTLVSWEYQQRQSLSHSSSSAQSVKTLCFICLTDCCILLGFIKRFTKSIISTMWHCFAPLGLPILWSLYLVIFYRRQLGLFCLARICIWQLSLDGG